MLSPGRESELCWIVEHPTGVGELLVVDLGTLPDMLELGAQNTQLCLHYLGKEIKTGELWYIDRKSRSKILEVLMNSKSVTMQW